jgi:adenine-specific DNA methylase
VALPLRELSEFSSKEKYVQTGNIATIHIWWARRPLAACRAVVFASLIPDPSDPECPSTYRNLIMTVLNNGKFKPTNADGSSVEDSPRGRCLEFLKHLVKWENSNDQAYIGPARTLIAAAHPILHPAAGEASPTLLDPFTGGGAIPLEALRLGCNALALDLNPVAHLIELCTLVYPQKFGQPNSRPIPAYIKRLLARNNEVLRAKSGFGLFDEGESDAHHSENEPLPYVEMTESDYRTNPLASDVRFWGHWVAMQAELELRQFYPPDEDGAVPTTYIWARTVECTNPQCRLRIPLIHQLWLARRSSSRTALRIRVNERLRRCEFDVLSDKKIDFDPEHGTMRVGKAQCPSCQTVISGELLRKAGIKGELGQQLVAVVRNYPDKKGQYFRAATNRDQTAYEEAVAHYRESIKPEEIPQESITPDRPAPNSRGLSAVVRYGLDHFDMLFNQRQLLALATFAKAIRLVSDRAAQFHDLEYANAIATIIGVNFGRAPDHWTTLCRWNPSGPKIQHAFGMQALAMVWDFAEANPFGGSVGDWLSSILSNGENAIRGASSIAMNPASVQQGSATALPFSDDMLDAVITDPPYYESVPYSDLSDFFYVWIKRVLARIHPDVLRTPLTPKIKELIAYYGPGKRQVQKPPEWYEEQMAVAFSEMRRAIRSHGVCCVMFAHKTTSAWERIIGGLLKSGLVVTASWPLHTEMKTRMVAMGAAALASSVTLVCRKRLNTPNSGDWDDVRQELKTVARERLDFFWNQGIRGADFFISAIGPALSVFGKYENVTKLSGEEVTVGQFLDEVRSLVTNYALTKILKTTHTLTINPETRFYVVWKWSYSDTKVPADESFKLSQALGLDTESLWAKTGVLEKLGENVQATPISKRIKIKNLGEPTADGAPASLIDVLHRMCAFREKNDTPGMGEFLGRSGQANNHSLWLVAQTVSEILPEGDKEKQLMQGLLNQKDGLEAAAREKKLF